jgi:hypothetical protein
MLLEKIVEIIEFTDTDGISEALEIFNKSGIVSGTAFPYLNVIFDTAPKQLCSKFKQLGFKGMVDIAKTNIDRVGDCYAVYDSTRYSRSDAQSWLTKFSNL